MVDAVKQEVECQADSVIRKPPRKECQLFEADDGGCGIILVNVEEKAMHQILDQSPKANTADPVRGSDSRIIQAPGSDRGPVCDQWQPDGGHNIPCGLAEWFQEVTEERSGLASLVVAGPMNLLQVKFLGESTVPELREQRLVKIQELVSFEILRKVGLDRQILFPRHSGGLVNEAILGLSSVGPRSFGFAGRIRGEKANVVVRENLVGSLGMLVGDLILHDLRHILARIVQDQVTTTRVVLHELGDIVHVATDGNVARFGAVMRLDLGRCEGR